MGFEEFIVACEEAKRITFSFKNPLIVHHYDADGISAGAIVQHAFLSRNYEHRILGMKKLDDNAIESLKNEKEIIFVDLGNNKRVDELNDVLIIDHHQPYCEFEVEQIPGLSKPENKKLMTNKPQINPMLYGIDGGNELSSSGTAYFIFGENAELGLVGALGDMQYPLQGMNRKMLEQGIANGEIKKTIDLKFYGRHSRPLVQFLAYGDEPFIPGISYREDKAQKLLEDLKITFKKDETWPVYSDLNEDARKKIISAIAEILSRTSREYNLIGEVYDLPKRQKKSALYDAHEFSTVLNACGRHGKPELGILVCLGNETACTEAAGFLMLHKKMICQGIAFAKSRIVDLGSFLFLDARGVINEGIIGIICGMVLQNSLKPIIGIADGENEDIKISSRVSKATGINLGKVLGRASESVGGIGGGHKIAAGAGIKKEKLNEFLLALKKNLEN